MTSSHPDTSHDREAEAEKVGQTGSRCCLTTTEQHRLTLASGFLWSLGSTYLVGSALERNTFRDVDLRMILQDEDFDRLFGHSATLWQAFCYAVARVLCEDTGMRIDFQVQRMTEANEKYDGPRCALIARDTPVPFAGLGDATRFDGGPDS